MGMDVVHDDDDAAAAAAAAAADEGDCVCVVVGDRNMVVESIVPERFVSGMVNVLCECPDSNPHFQSLVIALIPIWVPEKDQFLI